MLKTKTLAVPIALSLITTLYAEGGTTFCIEDVNSSITLKHREGDGIGYNKGYSTAEIFLTPNGINDFQYFLDLRAHRLRDGGKFAANGGLGARYSCGPCSPIYGINAYYDYRDDHKLPSHQIGLGLETFFDWIDIRANGYLPLGNKFHRSGPSFSGFSGNNLVFETKRFANLPKIEAEVGAYIPGPFSWVDLYLAAGPYYLFKRKRNGRTFGDSFGGEARLTAKPFNGLTIGVHYSYDAVFKSRVQGVIAYSFPMGPATLKRRGRKFQCRYGECQCVMLHVAKMVTPPHRAEIIPIETKKSFTTEPASSGLNFGNFQAIFVNPFAAPPNLLSAVGPGSGTFEDPYTNLTLAEGLSEVNDIIYVFNSNSGSSLTDVAITLKDQQRLIGSGVSFDFFGVTIPPFPGDEGKRVQLIAGSSNPVFTTALDNEIAGFAFTSSAAQSGVQTAANTGSLTIRDCLFQGIGAGSAPALSVSISGSNNISLTSNTFQNLDTGIDYALSDSNAINGFTATSNTFSTTTTPMSLIVTSPSPGAGITHIFDVQGNEFGTGPFLLQQAGGSSSNILEITFQDNRTSLPNGPPAYQFTNDGGSPANGAITINIPAGFPATSQGVSEANAPTGTPPANLPTTFLQNPNSAPIDVVPAP